MHLIVFLLLHALPNCISNSNIENLANREGRQISDVKYCREAKANAQLATMESIIGIGWDNLRNVPAAAVLATTFTKCRTTADDLYLLPDNVEAVPVKKIYLDRMANYYEHFKDYITTTAQTVNVEAGVHLGAFKISGSYSEEHVRTKQKFFEEKSSLLHTSLHYHAYTLLAEGAPSLHPTFVRSLLEIDAALKTNLTRKARFLSHMIVRNYGTHVIRTAYVGATIDQEDYIDSSVKFDQSSSLDSMKAAASASFFGGIYNGSIGASYQTTTTEAVKDQFKKMLRHSQVRTAGGPRINELLYATSSQMVANNSQANILVNDLVALDRSGEPIFTIITQSALPDVSQANLDTIVLLVKNATDEYYRRNTIKGCTNPTAPNFSFKANLDDGSCEQPFNNFTFGGIYQTCTSISKYGYYSSSTQWRCTDLNQLNGVTGAASCPTPDYEPIELFNFIYQFPDRHVRIWIFNMVYQDRVQLTATWCRARENATISQDKGFMFGGLYSKTQSNPFTAAHTCPGRYQSYRLGPDVTVCLSRDYQLDGPYSIPFGGFFSCQTPRASAKCPDGYSQHLATVFDGCDVYYCVRPEVFKQLQPPAIQRPPYDDDLSIITSNDSTSTLYVYVNDSLYLRQSLETVLAEARDIMIDAANKKAKNGENADPHLLSGTISEETALNEWLRAFNPASRNPTAQSMQTMKPNEQSIHTPIWALVTTSIFVVGVIAIGVFAIMKRHRQRAPIRDHESVPFAVRHEQQSYNLIDEAL